MISRFSLVSKLRPESRFTRSAIFPLWKICVKETRRTSVYRGISKLSEQWTEAEDFDNCENDVHLYKVREMEANPLLQRLIDAYEADYPEVDHGKV